MSYKTLNEVQDEVMSLYENGQDRGESTGFKTLDDHYRVKKGCTTYVTGTPSHGKTHFAFELLLNLTASKGWKHALYTPETGSDPEITALLMEKHLHKKFDKLYRDRMTKTEAAVALGYLSQAFFLIDQEGVTSVDEVLEVASKIKKDHGLNSLMIDPWNELIHDFSRNGGREDKYLEFTLGKIRRFARKNGLHAFIVAHPKTLHKNKDGTYEPATAWDISGGAPWYAKGESIICVHRPDDTNRSEIIIQKAKPQIIGKKGTCDLYYDLNTGRYYEFTNGKNLFAFGKENLNHTDNPTINFQSPYFDEPRETEVPF